MFVSQVSNEIQLVNTQVMTHLRISDIDTTQPEAKHCVRIQPVEQPKDHHHTNRNKHTLNHIEQDLVYCIAVSRLSRCPTTTWDNEMSFPELGTRPFYTVPHDEDEFGHDNTEEPAVVYSFKR